MEGNDHFQDDRKHVKSYFISRISCPLRQKEWLVAKVSVRGTFKASELVGCASSSHSCTCTGEHNGEYIVIGPGQAYFTEGAGIDISKAIAEEACGAKREEHFRRWPSVNSGIRFIVESVPDCPVFIGGYIQHGNRNNGSAPEEMFAPICAAAEGQADCEGVSDLGAVEQPRRTRSFAGRADLRRKFGSFETAVLYLLQRLAVEAETGDTTVYNRVLHSVHRGNHVGVVLLSPSVNSGMRSVGILVELPRKNHNGRFRAGCVRFSVKTCPSVDGGLSETDLTVSCSCWMNFSGEQCGHYDAVFRREIFYRVYYQYLDNVLVNLYQRRRPKKACGHVYRVPLS